MTRPDLRTAIGAALRSDPPNPDDNPAAAGLVAQCARLDDAVERIRTDAASYAGLTRQGARAISDRAHCLANRANRSKDKEGTTS